MNIFKYRKLRSNSKRTIFYLIIAFISITTTNKSFAICNATVLTTGSASFCGINTVYKPVGDIVLDETGGGCVTAFNWTGVGTYVLDLPAGYEYNTAAVITFSYTAARDIQSVTYAYTSVTRLTITITTDAPNKNDDLTISGIEVKNQSATASGNITYNAGASTGTFTNLVDGTSNATLTYSPVSSKTWVSGATWSTATWSPAGVPGTCDNVIIPNTANVTVTGATSINSLTIQSGGTLTTTAAITVGGTFTIDNGGTYIHNNATDPATTIFAGATSFGATSTFHATNWSSGAVPLGQFATQFGHIILDAGVAVWDQDGTFAPNKIKGNVTILSDQINWDDGTGATTALTIDGNITVSGTGGCIFAQGADRNLTLVTGSYTHSGTALSAGMYLTVGVFDWTVNGDISVSQDFTGIQGSGAEVATCNVTTTGDFNITGGLFDWNRGINGNVNLTIGGDINITGAPGWVRFNDSNAGTITATCTNFTIAGGADNDFQKGTGDVSITCSGVFTVSGGTTHVLDILADGNLTFSANSMVQTAGTIEYISDGAGNITSFTCTNTFDMDGGIFYGIDNSTPTANGLITASFGAIDFDGGNFTLSDGNNNTAGTITLGVTNNLDVNFTAGTDGFGLINVISSGFPAATNNTLLLDLDVGGDLIVSGNTTALFFTSGTTGDEAIDIVGNLTWSGGIKYFNGSEAAGNGHNVVLNVGGNATFSGGSGHLSGVNGNITATITGNTLISGGTHAIKVLDGTGTYSTTNFSQTGGTFYAHKSNTNSTADVVATTVNGTFSHTGGTFNFDPNTSSTATHTLTLNGTSCTLGGTGSITHASAGTGTVFGEIYYNEAGTMTFSRTSTTHQIDQTRQIVNAICTLDASGSANYMQLAANNAADDAIPATTIMLDVLGTITLGTNQIIGRSESATQRPTSVYVKSGGEIQTGIAAGFYDGTVSAALVHFTRNSANTNNTVNSMNWYLDAASTVTYNGSVNQVTTGIYPADFVSSTNSNIVLGTNAGYHYGNLKINHQGTIGTNFVYPAASNVFVRTQLELLRGEYAFDGSGTGYTVTVENPATTGVSKTGADGDAYIKSETNLATNPSILRWYMENTAGAHIIPFGHSAGAANYIPFTFTVNTGTAGAYVDVSTRATDDGTAFNNAENIPWTTGVTSMYDPTLGQDGSTEAVIDRWWQIDVSAAYNADMTFTYRGAENTMVAPYLTGLLGAQRWNTGTTKWEPPIGSAAAVTAGTGSVTAAGITNFSPWILSSLAAPLPIELLSFYGNCDDKDVVLKWTTISEINNDYFIIQKSADGTEFTNLGTVNGAGNSSGIINYSFVDDNSTGTAFYRIEQVDFDGKTSFSDIISVSNCASEIIRVVPNPSNGTFDVQFGENIRDVYTISVLDIAGKLVYQNNISPKETNNKHRINLSDQPKGIYLFRAYNEKTSINIKVILE